MLAQPVAALRASLCLGLALVSACGDSDTTAGGAPATGGSGGEPSAGAAGPGGGGQGGADGGGGNAGGQGGGGASENSSQGCIDGAGLSEGEHGFMLDGHARRYVLRLPAGYTPDQAWPLVLALHGNGGSVDYWDVTTGDRNIRGVLQDHAILVIAEAIEGNWRDYDQPPESWPARVELELGYFEEVLRQVQTDLCVDQDELFAMGFSGGGSFSGLLGCRRTDIRAIAVGGSVLYFDPTDCLHAPAAWITIGELELTAGREEFRDFFRDLGGCSSTSAPTDPSPCQAYDACDTTTPVHYCQHPGDHVWPDFGSAAMWGFFQAFVD
jgi:polyhydroxybutyrate depolymerase